MLRCRVNIPPTLAKLAKWGKICAQQSEFPGNFWPTECAKSRRNMLLILYPILALLESKGGRWGAGMQG